MTSSTHTHAPTSPQTTADASAALMDLADDWASLFRLLADPTRLRLLVAMHHHGAAELTVQELAECTDVHFKTASSALRMLATAGVVHSVIDGRCARYSLADDRVHTLVHHIGGTHAPL